MELPAEFTDRMCRLLGDEYDDFATALLSEPQTSLRLNPAKCNGRPDYQPVSWCRDAYYIETRPAFTFDPRLHGGVYYVQEASSMFLDYVLRQFVDTPVRYLDLCAAPGGKSTLALSALPAGSLVVCNEVVRNRTHILAENVVKWGYDNTIVTRNTAADFGKLHHYFDVILVDAPCSGEGMFRKDTQATTEWSPAQVGVCAERQREILSDVWDALRPGGLLIYSTCTYNREENEDMIRFLCDHFDATPLAAAPPAAWHIHPSLDKELPAYRFMPHYTRGEGLFMAIVRKPGNADECERDEWLQRAVRKNGKNRNKRPAAKGDTEVWRSWVSAPEKYVFDTDDESVTALPTSLVPDYDLFATRFDIVHRGIPVASRKGREWQPHHALALSTSLNTEAFDALPLTFDEAIAYLRRETWPTLADPRRGMRLVTCDGLPLGWCNHLGNRINNLYPQEWRIRSGYRPENPNLPVW